MSNTPRLARADDLPGIVALYRELRPADPQLAQEKARALLSALLSDPAISLVVCDHEGTLAATCMLAIVPHLANGGQPFGVIEHVVTLSRFRRGGLARRVLQFALDCAWAKGCYKVVLLSGVHRAEAHKLYESLGFRGDVERGFVLKRADAV